MGSVRAEAMNLVARKLEHGHGRKRLHHGAVLLGEVKHRIAPRGSLDAGCPAREDQAGGETLDVVLEGPANGLVKVVDVEDEAAVERGEGAEIEDVGVAAELRGDAGVGMAGEVGGHDRHGSSKEAEGAGGHALVLDGDEAGDASVHGGAQKLERILCAGGEPESCRARCGRAACVR